MPLDPKESCENTPATGVEVLVIGNGIVKGSNTASLVKKPRM